MKNFLKNRIAELHNVTWPTRKQAVHSMITVLSIMLIVGVFLGVVDYFFNEGILFFLNR
ncbi:preprotein translocase subunit SecE [Candidatus Gracilibacteria bacterium]|nr:preprotein translocase subunit SecE [Candidatus Gracilibacteria bacterium]